MMALVVYDSVFGNTEKVARAIANGLGTLVEVEQLRAGGQAALDLEGVDLLVVGSPTRGFRPTEALDDLLKRLRSGSLRGVNVAAFDTRFKADEIKSRGVRFVVKAGGYAAKRIASQLKSAGGELIAPPEGFFVEDTEGPLKPGELERAAAWGTHLTALMGSGHEAMTV